MSDLELWQKVGLGVWVLGLMFRSYISTTYPIRQAELRGTTLARISLILTILFFAYCGLILVCIAGGLIAILLLYLTDGSIQPYLYTFVQAVKPLVLEVTAIIGLIIAWDFDIRERKYKGYDYYDYPL